MKRRACRRNAGGLGFSNDAERRWGQCTHEVLKGKSLFCYHTESMTMVKHQGRGEMSNIYQYQIWERTDIGKIAYKHAELQQHSQTQAHPSTHPNEHETHEIPWLSLRSS